MVQESNRAHADQALTGLSLHFDIPANTTAAVRFDYYVRQLEFENNSNPASTVWWGFSQTGILAGAPGGYNEMFPTTARYTMRFYRDDEGPPWIFFRNTNLIDQAIIDLYYFPTQKRDKQVQPTVGGNQGYPEANRLGWIHVPGL